MTITSNVKDGIICYKHSIQLTCHAYDVIIPKYKWTSTIFKQTKDTPSITVVATHDSVEYKCMVTDIFLGKSGYSSVSISSNGEFIV